MGNGSNGTQETDGVGAGLVGIFGIIALAVYLVGGALFTAYSLVDLWPDASARSPQSVAVPAKTQGSAPTTNQSPSNTGATAAPGTPAAPKAPSNEPQANAGANQDAGRSSGAPPSSSTSNSTSAGRSMSPAGGTAGTGSAGSSGTTGSSGTESPSNTGSGVDVTSYLGIQINGSLQRLTILIVLFSGALGGLVHALRSFFWYVGSRELKWSWVPMYVLLPFTGALLGLIFYIVLVAGLFAGTPGPDAKLAGFAAIAALVGMFSTPAALKLQEIFETIFAKRQEGKDAVKPVDTPMPVVKRVTVTAGPGGAGQTLSVEGTDFQAPLTVKVANSAGATTPVTAKNVTSATFQADVTLAAGTWSITVVGKDGKAAQPVAFTV